MAKDRKNGYTYHVSLWKDGGMVPVKVTARAFKPVSICEPINHERVGAFDTEAITWDGRLMTDLISTAYHDSTNVHEMRHVYDEPLEGFLEEIVQKFGQDEERASRTVRKGESGKDEKAPRAAQPLGVLVMFNGPYDVTRLFPRQQWLQAIHSGLTDYVMCVSDRFEIEWKFYLDKSAPQFQWYVRDRHAERFARVQGVDMTGYWKCSLERALKAVGLKGKVDVAAEVADVFERPREDFSKKELEARKTYAEVDGKRHLELYWETAKLLERIDPRVINKKGLIPPSAPGAAARIMFARAFDIHPMVKEWLRPPDWADELGAASYYGGRAFASNPGRHVGLASRDIKSAYPTAMCLLPDPVTTVYRKVGERPFRLEEWGGKWGTLMVSGESLDDRYPAFRVHHYNRLRYVYGKFNRVCVTIPELCVGLARGVLKDLHIHDGVWLDGDCKTSFLRHFVLDFFRLKENNPKGSPLNELAKLLINSAYGKLIEVQEKDVVALGDAAEVRVPDYSEHVHARAIISSLVRVASATLEGAYIDPDHLFFGRKSSKAIRRHTYENEIASGQSPLEAYLKVARRFGCPGDDVPLKAVLRHARTYKAGPFFLPAFASQITGYVSAQLGLMGECMNAVVGDTDSIAYVKDRAEPQRLAQYHKTLRRAGYFSAEEGADAIDGTTLGRWCLEMVDSHESYVVRPKRYSHKYLDQSGDVAYKQAHHGMSRYTTPEAEAWLKDTSISKDERTKRAYLQRQVGIHDAMRRQLNGEIVTFTQRRAPRKGRTAARSGDTVGEFVAHEVSVENGPIPGTRLTRDGWIAWEPLDQKKDAERRM